MLPKKAKVLKATKENEKVSTLEFGLDAQGAMPGQFAMVWLPGFDEKPMSISGVSPNLSITVAAVGPASRKIASAKPGDFLFLRYPLGKGFEFVGKKWLLVGGGYGFAPLRYLASVGIEMGKEVQAIIGARSKDSLIFPAKCKTHIATDDGSEGEKGTAIDLMEKLLAKNKFDCIYSCGPEKMMHAVAKLAKKHNISSQLLLERYMKCGFGVCGHCACGSFITCIDGPMIRGEDALKLSEFGKIHKDKAGREVEW